MTRVPFQRSAAGSALISTLLVIVVLSIIVVAFLQSMSTERQTARSYMNRYKAELAAKAGSEAAMDLVKNLIQTYPDSATIWDVDVSGHKTPATSLVFFDPSPLAPSTGESSPKTTYQPLVSGFTQLTFDPTQDRGQATLSTDNVKSNGGTQEWVNINTSTFGYGDGSLWVGKFPTQSATLAKNAESEINVPWVDLTVEDPAHPGSKIVTARYAFWVEDESFRINLNTSSLAERGGNTLGKGPKEIPIQGLAAVKTDAQSALDKSALASGVDSIRSVFKDDKNPPTYSIPSSTELNRAITSLPHLHRDLGILTTITSSGLNQSRTGARRLNINAVFAQANPSADDIRKQLDRAISAIDQQAPDFGQRFYRIGSDLNHPGVDSGSATSHDRIYLEKLAANIRDYIDPDSQPTVVMNDSERSIYDAGAPRRAIRPIGNAANGSGTNSTLAIGKENVPRLQQTMLRVKQYLLQSGNSSPYQLKLSYYFEFWNTGTKDIHCSDAQNDLGPGAFLEIANQPGWRYSQTKAPILELMEDPSRDRKIPLTAFKDGSGNDLVFKAGEVTVLTNDPNPETMVGSSGADFLKSTSEAQKIYRVTGYEEVTPVGTVPKCSKTDYGGLPTLEMQTRDQQANSPTGANGTQGYDLRTEVFLGTNAGWLESHHEALPIYPSVYVDAFGSKSNTSILHMRGGTLQGNIALPMIPNNHANPVDAVLSAAPCAYGDPTANNEQLDFLAGASSSKTSSTEVRTAFVSWRNPTIQSSADTKQRNSLTAQNTAYVNPGASGNNAWPETAKPTHTLDPLATGGGLYTIKDGSMDSIGELGFLHDPRRQTVSGIDIKNVPGGARTLNIGTSETDGSYPVWDKAPLSKSRNWTAWRLVDIFSTTDSRQIPGMVNLNGVLRDDGAPLRAMLTGLKFSSDLTLTDYELPEKSLSETEIDKLVTSLKTYIAGAGGKDRGLPLFERGELSELDYFSTADSSKSGSPGGKTLDQLNNRGREELFRRIVEMVTPRGNTFTVYVVGQAVRQTSRGIEPLSTYAKKVTFRLKPVYSPDDDTSLNTFSPETDAGTRFAKPIRYDIEILP
jgi:hypothetical protein